MITIEDNAENEKEGVLEVLQMQVPHVYVMDNNEYTGVVKFYHVCNIYQ